ncbi:MAG: DUF4367 domain-containing protein [Clostridia bacterium]|nr:DUF4367 domain-containing protein [Clostridia bacterium]
MTEKERLGKTALLEAMRRFDLTYPESFPREETGIPHSRAYLRALRRLSQSIDRVEHRPRLSAWKRAMMVAITLTAVLFSAVTISAAATGKSFSSYVTTLYEYFAEIVFGEEEIVAAPEKIDAVYSLSWFPQHYAIESADIGAMTSQIVWRNGEGDRLILHQGLLTSHELMIHGEAGLETLTVNGTEVTRFARGGQVFFFWSQYGYAFELSGPTTVSREDYVRMIESLRESSLSRDRTNSWWTVYRDAYTVREEE